jgi:hypothetical protein
MVSTQQWQRTPCRWILAPQVNTPCDAATPLDAVSIELFFRPEVNPDEARYN